VGGCPPPPPRPPPPPPSSSSSVQQIRPGSSGAEGTGRPASSSSHGGGGGGEGVGSAMATAPLSASLRSPKLPTMPGRSSGSGGSALRSPFAPRGSSLSGSVPRSTSPLPSGVQAEGHGGDAGASSSDALHRSFTATAVGDGALVVEPRAASLGVEAKAGEAGEGAPDVVSLSLADLVTPAPSPRSSPGASGRTKGGVKAAAAADEEHSPLVQALMVKLRAARADLAEAEEALHTEIAAAALLRAESDTLRGALAKVTSHAQLFARVLDALRDTGAWLPSEVPSLARFLAANHATLTDGDGLAASWASVDRGLTVASPPHLAGGSDGHGASAAGVLTALTRNLDAWTHPDAGLGAASPPGESAVAARPPAPAPTPASTSARARLPAVSPAPAPPSPPLSEYRRGVGDRRRTATPVRRGDGVGSGAGWGASASARLSTVSGSGGGGGGLGSGLRSVSARRPVMPGAVGR
jgi:hypothetical protein